MEAEPERHEFSEASLDSPEYRERLQRKLNCLIAVLEVATAKVRQSLAGPAPDVERLLRIQRNLQDTLEVCLRARAALERRGTLPSGLSRDLARAVNPTALGAELSARDATRARGTDCLSEAERARFARLPKIDRAMIAVTDFDELARLLAR
jgi:hypothetical protein